MYQKFIILYFVLCAVYGLPHVKVTMPPSCKGKNYCFEKSENYPQEEIDKIIKELSHRFVKKGSDEGIIGNRDGEGNREKPNDDCERDTRFDKIYEIVDETGTERYVVQSDNLFEQIIRTEACVNPGRITTNSNFFPDTELERLNLSCVQKNINYNFLVLGLDGKTFEHARVKDGLPICCSCMLLSM